MRVSFLLASSKVDVCFIQETKLSSFNDVVARSFWGGIEVDWTVSHSEGASGGMANLWKKGSLNLNYSFKALGYVGINVWWKSTCVNLVNIYAPCNAVARRDLWKSLVDRRNNCGGEEWCLGGDFNEITSREERLGGVGYLNVRGMEEFREFFVRMGVVDIPCVGGRFTWFKDNGKAMSRIDRFLVSRNLIDMWGVVDQRIGSREFSDHAPIRLNCGIIDWGPKPFRFNNTWFKHKTLKPSSMKSGSRSKLSEWETLYCLKSLRA
ncbi:uncharacterized protein LOC131635919 [Vicia villosa]|uniref:uncharacterized protein LOC131635919 n=1 Tax=Vicia villosa TaxID=3911 RepID=UPI00273C2457|nr:uncharacterized protein LOC131635919 [Vicia villosa]